MHNKQMMQYKKFRLESSTFSTRISSAYTKRPQSGIYYKYNCQSGQFVKFENENKNQENWTNEHILQYRAHLEDIRNLQKKWKRQLNQTNEKKIIEIPFDLSFDRSDSEKCIQIRRRPCSSVQRSQINHIQKIDVYQKSVDRQKKKQIKLSEDQNYINRSFRCYTTIQDQNYYK